MIIHLDSIDCQGLNFVWPSSIECIFRATVGDKAIASNVKEGKCPSDSTELSKCELAEDEGTACLAIFN